MYAMIARASTIAGMKPATNSAATDTLAIEPSTIIRMHGGTRMPIAEAGDVGEGRARHAREDVLRDHHRHGEPAADPAHQRLREAHQADGDAAGLHQHAGEDEKRDREQHERVHRLVHLLRDDDERELTAPRE